MYYPPNVNSIFNPGIVCKQTIDLCVLRVFAVKKINAETQRTQRNCTCAIFKKPDYFNCEIYGKETLSISLGQKKRRAFTRQSISDAELIAVVNKNPGRKKNVLFHHVFWVKDLC